MGFREYRQYSLGLLYSVFFLTLECGQYNFFHGIVMIKLQNMPSKEYICLARQGTFLTLTVVLLNRVFIGIVSEAVKNNYRLKTSLFVLVEIRSVTHRPIHTCPMKEVVN